MQIILNAISILLIGIDIFCIIQSYAWKKNDSARDFWWVFNQRIDKTNGQDYFRFLVRYSFVSGISLFSAGILLILYVSQMLPKF